MIRRKSISLVAANLFLGVTLLASPAGAADAPPAAKAPAKGDVRRGWNVFVAKSCARCHAVFGHGGEVGPDLGRTHAGALTDAELAAALWNHIPRMWGKMKEERIPQVPINEAEMADLFAYLSFVRAIDEPGDPDNGRRLLEEKRCATCHTVGDKSNGVGPDLRRWAHFRNPAVWAKLMFDHASQMVQAMRARNIPQPSLSASELVDIVSYIRSMSPTGEAELLDPGDAALGEKLFREKSCIQCHTVHGVGGKVGPELGRKGWETSFTGIAIKAWNSVEKMRAAMASRNIQVPVLTPQEMAHVITYLFAATYADEPGSPEKGAALLRDKGCVQCHGKGAGPDLDKYRNRATPVTVAQALWMHGPTMLERMRDLEVRWPSLTGEEMRHVLAALNVAPPESAGGTKDNKGETK